MTERSGEALDVALGLLRAPALRGALRARSLPEGVSEVLAIASGSAERARSAAERTGYTDVELVEAARFYVQQVLLVQGADAYRTLGADHSADHATLRDHHRLLLRWLHPDRSEGAQWDSALATRVNQAWNHVRTDAARAQYDTTNSLAPPVGAATAATPGTRRATLPKVAAVAAPTDGEPVQSRAAPLAVALLGLACVVLAWLAITRQDLLHEEPATPNPAPASVGAATAAIPSAEEAAVAALGAPRRSGREESRERARVQAKEGEGRERQGTLDEDQEGTIAAIAAPTIAATPAATPTPISSPAPSPVGAAIAAIPNATERPARIAAVAAPTKADRALAAETPAPAHPEPMQLFLEAETTLRTVTTYFAAGDGPEPAWLDIATGLEAAGARERLRSRHGGRAYMHMELTDPSWTLGSHAASVHGAYRLDRRGPVETGMLRVELTRLGQHWRVAAVQLEPAQ
ncbi:DnaJ domain-containing protein [Luteimonas sp. MJ246]|uniref:DnaJ domain-containing protein n=1 Tax=Luteimonas sp. MJ174 TaxID=3129237 RepID=UPI0031BBC359